MNIRVVYTCYLCSSSSRATDIVKPDPTGWRKVRRGFLGFVYICPACTKAGRNYHRDMP